MTTEEAIAGTAIPRPDRRSTWGGTLRRFLATESGSATVIAAFGLVAIMGMLALAVDVGQMRYRQRSMQRAADAASLAATLEIPYCVGSNNCAAMQTAAVSAMAENGVTGATLVTDCGTAPGTGLVLTISNPPCSIGTRDPDMGKATSVEVLLTQQQPSGFSSVLGSNIIPVGARAEAAASAGTNCIYALDPSGSNTLNVLALASLSTPCGVMVESSSSSAFSCALLGVVSARQLSVVGGAFNLLCLINPTPALHVAFPAIPDPLSYLPAPAMPACGTTTGSPYHGAPSAINITGTATLYSDAAYCGGITIGSGANVTFQPGTYVLTSTNGALPRLPGGLTVNVGSSVTGTGVTFYNYGPVGGITFNSPFLSLAGVKLYAPTSGTYKGILFFQPPNNTSSATIVGSAAYNTVLQGAYYLPKANVTFAFDGPVSYNMLIAWHITFEALTFGFTTVTSGFANDYTTLIGGSPLLGAAAILQQ